jgi:hypothetical protein
MNLSGLSRVSYTSRPISVGSILAANGDWSRKYAVFERDGVLHARFLGRFYADGRIVYAKKPRVFPLHFKASALLPDSSIRVWDLPPSKAVGSGQCEYWHVVPRSMRDKT